MKKVQVVYPFWERFVPNLPPHNSCGELRDGWFYPDRKEDEPDDPEFDGYKVPEKYLKAI